MSNPKIFLNEDERDCLQELMNISYGAATAAIAEIINKFATLNIPKIRTLNTEEFEEYFTNKFEKYETYYVTNQKTDGTLNGENMFIMNEDSVINLAHEFDLDDDEIDDDELKDVILEITNIISSTTLSKLADLIKTNIIFSPPSVKKVDATKLIDERYKTEYQHVIIIATEIKFEEQNIYGELIIMSKEETIDYIKEALNKLLEEF